MSWPTDFCEWAGLDGSQTVLGGRVNGNGPVAVTKPGRARLSWLSVDSMLMAGACLVLGSLAVAMGVVSWHAQYSFVYSVKHQHLASALESLGLDAGAVVFAILGIALARLRRRAAIERVLVCLCALGSAGMNLLGADLASPRSVAVYVMPPLLFAAGSDRLIAVVRRAALGTAADSPDGRSAWHAAGKACLYLLRFPVAPRSTASGARRALLMATPLPEAPARTSRPGGTPLPPAVTPALPGPRPAAGRAVPGTKTAVFLALVEEKHGPLSKIRLDRVGAVSGELAAAADLHEGSARSALKKAIEKARRDR